MKAWERFEHLARQARREPIPPIDVTGRVMAAIGRQAAVVAPPERYWSLAILAGLSILAASIIAGLTLDAWSLLADPPAGILQPLSWVLS